MKTSLRPAATLSPHRRSRPRVKDLPYPKTCPSGQHPRRQILRLAVGAAALPAASRIAGAQAYPTRPITMVVPFAAGGGADVIGRILIDRMRVSLGQPVIIENVSGANGSIGVGRVARAAPDGYTLVIGNWQTHVANGAVYPLQYDLLNDLEPISLIVSNPLLIAAKKTMPANQLGALVAWLKANLEKASLGTSGVGSVGHVSGIFFQNITGTRFQFVPYRGAGLVMQDLIAGQIDMMIETPAISLPQLRAGSIKVYAVAAESRLAAAPDIPTVDEAGLPGFYFSSWTGLWSPKGTPKNVIMKLNAATVDALAAPAVRSRLADLGPEIFPREQQTPEALATIPQSRNREMVAHHQGGRHQGAVTPGSVVIQGGHDETSPPQILASGRECCRAAGRLSRRASAGLSVAAGARDCTIRAIRPDRCLCAGHRSTAKREFRKAIHRPEHCWCSWQHRHRTSSKVRTRWLYHTHHREQLRCKTDPLQ